MFANLTNVICINTRLEAESRRLTLFEYLKTRDIHYQYRTSILNTRSSKLGQRLARRHYIIPHALSLFDSSYILFGLISYLISYNLFSVNRKIITIIVCFNSWYLYPSAFILSYFPKVQLVVDLGYPIDDISTIGLPYNFKRIVRFLENFIYSRPINILVESKEQQARLQSVYSSPKFYTFHVLNSSGLSLNSQTVLPGINKLQNPHLRYILFRGTLNPESGITNIITDFIDFKQHNPSCDIKLYIKGNGEFASQVLDKACEYDDIIFIDSYLDNDSLTTLMAESAAMIGQFGTSDRRLNYTLPHKFIEAIKLRKLYLSPLSLPIEEYYRLLLSSNELELLRHSHRPLSFWLSLLQDSNRIPTFEQIIHASKVIEDELTSVNHASLTSCNL
jgi:hypothetical protein